MIKKKRIGQERCRSDTMKVYEIPLRDYVLIYRPLIVKVVTGYLGNILYIKFNLNRFVTNRISTFYQWEMVVDSTAELKINAAKLLKTIVSFFTTHTLPLFSQFCIYRIALLFTCATGSIY